MKLAPSRARALWRGAVLLALIPAGACGFNPSGKARAGGGDGGGGRADAAVDGFDGSMGGDAQADAGSDPLASFDCPHTDVPPYMDGQAAGPWLDTTFTTFDISDAQLAADVAAGYDNDDSVSFACLNDADNVYFFFDVTDDEVVSDSLALRDDDGVVLFLDGRGDRDGDYDSYDHAIMLAAAGDALDYGPGTLDPDGVVRVTGHGYDIEITLVKTDVGPIPADGIIGFNLALIDDDGIGNADRDIFGLRYVPSPPACDRCCQGEAQPWCDTTVTGGLTLDP